MLRKFLAETNSGLVDVWNSEDGRDHRLAEATNIATKQVEKIIIDMRKAIEAGDSKKEEKLRQEAKKAMAQATKLMMKEFHKNLDQWMKEQTKYLSDKYGMPAEIIRDSKPAVSFGNQNSYITVKTGFSGVLMVEPPFPEDKGGGDDEEDDLGDGEAEWGFDLTHFDKPANFEKLLKAVGIPAKAEKKDGTWFWTGPGIEIRTGNNPLTGEYGHGSKKREDDPGFASYIGIKGNADKVKKAAAYIRKFDPKEETPNSARFI